MIAEHWGWRAAFGAVGFPGLVMALLFLLALGAIPGAMLPQRSLNAQKVADYIARPVEPLVQDGPVVVAAAGSAAIVPWALLPGLSGRAISVSPSVTAAVAGMGRTAEAST